MKLIDKCKSFVTTSVTLVPKALSLGLSLLSLGLVAIPRCTRVHIRHITYILRETLLRYIEQLTWELTT